MKTQFFHRLLRFQEERRLGEDDHQEPSSRYVAATTEVSQVAIFFGSSGVPTLASSNAMPSARICAVPRFKTATIALFAAHEGNNSVRACISRRCRSTCQKRLRAALGLLA